jgi:hypothetical protein
MDSMPRKRWKKRYILLALPVLLAPLFVSLSPNTPIPSLPNANQVSDARFLAERVSANANHASGSDITVSWREVESATLLLSRATPFHHIALKRGTETLNASLSVPLWFGLWINADAIIPASEKGFPAVHGRVGYVPIPPFLARGILGLGRTILGWRGIELPALDDMVQTAAFSPEGAAARIRIPKDIRLLRVFAQSEAAEINVDEVIARYCGLALAQQSQPDADFLNHVHRAFTSFSTVTDYAASNRASLLALAMFTVSPNVGKIAGIQPDRLRGCAGSKLPPRLLGRDDLPKHWALSAALTAVLGSDLSQNMGVWKEVADSGPNGSGFSFIDLAADRSGISFGKRATASDQAEATTMLLRSISAEKLLPIRALALQEGMNETQFAQRYTQVDSARYQAMVKRIDQLLGTSQ